MTSRIKNVSRVRPSLKTFPPYVVGTTVYQINVRSHDPEVDQGMSEIPEQHPGQANVDPRGPTERPRDQQRHLGHDAERRDDPHRDVTPARNEGSGNGCPGCVRRYHRD